MQRQFKVIVAGWLFVVFMAIGYSAVPVAAAETLPSTPGGISNVVSTGTKPSESQNEQPSSLPGRAENERPLMTPLTSSQIQPDPVEDGGLNSGSTGGPPSPPHSDPSYGPPKPSDLSEKDQCESGTGLSGLRQAEKLRHNFEVLNQCKSIMQRDALMFCISLLIFLYSRQLNTVASSFSDDLPDNRSSVYNHVKHVASFPCALSLVLYLTYSILISDFILDLEIGRDSNGCISLLYYIIPVNIYFNLFMLGVAFVLSAAAAWKLNIALPKGISGGDFSVRFFAIISPLLSITASLLTISKIVTT